MCSFLEMFLCIFIFLTVSKQCQRLCECSQHTVSIFLYRGEREQAVLVTARAAWPTCCRCCCPALLWHPGGGGGGGWRGGRGVLVNEHCFGVTGACGGGGGGEAVLGSGSVELWSWRLRLRPLGEHDVYAGLWGRSCCAAAAVHRLLVGRKRDLHSLYDHGGRLAAYTLLTSTAERRGRKGSVKKYILQYDIYNS